MTDIHCELLVIGAGPGGYVCAIRAAQLGVDTVVVEAESPGGSCLNVGCIPSKALIHAADEFHKLMHLNDSPLGIRSAAPTLDFTQTLAWKDGIVARLNSGVAGLLRAARARLLSGSARFVDGKTIRLSNAAGEQLIHAKKIVIATGAKPTELPSLPFGGDVISSTEALALSAVPSRLVVVGGGYIGLELGTAFAKLGSKLTVVESGDEILPLYDQALTQPVKERLLELGAEILTSTTAEAATPGALVVRSAGGETREIPADKILVAVGRTPRTEAVGLSELSLTMNGPCIDIDDHCQSSMRGVYAIGDVTGGPMLAHRAMAQGQMVAEIVAGMNRQWDKRCIPAVCFTDPEIVDCGLSPGAAELEGVDVVTGVFPLAANGRAMTTGTEAGFVRVLARADNHLVLGMQAVGAGVSELSAAFAIALEMGARLEDIAGTVHAHPTQSEALQEACLQALGQGLHL